MHTLTHGDTGIASEGSDFGLQHILGYNMQWTNWNVCCAIMIYEMPGQYFAADADNGEASDFQVT